MKKFWDWIKNEAGERILRLDGPIDEESLWGDEITPEAFREELEDGEGDVTVWINSPGGNVFAAAEIYTMLKDYAGKITVKIDAIAASAASVVAMAGDRVLMSPVAMMMIHDPSTVAAGNARDMEHAISVLTEVKESIINAYAAKTGLSHARIASLMANESWMNAKKAVELGFADEILFDEKDDSDGDEEPDEKSGDAGSLELEAQLYSGKQMSLKILNRLGVNTESKPPSKGVETREDLEVDDSAEPQDEAKPPVAPLPTVEDILQDESPPIPIIGMDGTTEDGSVPYLILEKQLECLR